MGTMIAWLKKEKVLLIALALALISMPLTPPDAGYLEYIDLRTLALLFCLMLLVKGFQGVGLFDWLIGKAFGRVKTLRRLCVMLVLLCFFTSMIITNDVALITFVPFAMLALQLCGQEAHLILVVVLQTIAANLGSMATPIGNPQNLYLFSMSGMPIGTFFGAMLPLTALSLLLILLATLAFPREPIHMALPEHESAMPRRELIAYMALFGLNLLVVFRVMPWSVALVATVAGVLLMRKARLLKQVDWALLMTFVGFFVFVGNLGRVDAISAWLQRALEGREVLLSALMSQALSNVPAALLLSGFTENYPALLAGVNIGGLGTLIASMASLISYKFYAARPDARRGRYLAVFTVYNAAGLVILLLFRLLIA